MSILTTNELFSRGIVHKEQAYSISTHSCTFSVFKQEGHLLYLDAVVSFPEDVCGILSPRSGVSGSTGFIDPGFNGQLVAALFKDQIIHSDPYKLVCFSVESPDTVYSGQYQNKVYEQLSMITGGVV